MRQALKLSNKYAGFCRRAGPLFGRAINTTNRRKPRTPVSCTTVVRAEIGHAAGAARAKRRLAASIRHALVGNSLCGSVAARSRDAGRGQFAPSANDME